MNGNKTIMQQEQLKAIARYEAAFTDIFPLPDECDEIEELFDVQDNYQYTLEDLHVAVKNILEKNPTVKELAWNWFYPVSYLSDAFVIDDACRYGTDFDYDEDIVPDCIQGLTLTAENIFARVWSGLSLGLNIGEADDRASDILKLHKYLREMDAFFAEKD